MAEALAKKPALQELHLSGNSLGDVGVATLVRGAVRGRGLRGDSMAELIHCWCDPDVLRTGGLFYHDCGRYCWTISMKLRENDWP